MDGRSTPRPCDAGVLSGEAERIQAEYARREHEVADRYDAARPENRLAAAELDRLLQAALADAGLFPLDGRRALDVGCGFGHWLARFEAWGADRAALAGIDLVEARAQAAAARLPGADVRAGDAAALPFADGAFDVVFHSMMFSSILDPQIRRRAAAEMARVLAPGGAVLWYDFFVSDPRNRNVTGMRKREIRTLFPGFTLHLRRATLLPPLARVVVPRSRGLGQALTALRLLDGHYVGTLRRG